MSSQYEILRANKSRSSRVKLYYNTTKRIAKKVLGLRYWNKLNYARNLKPGDLISSCTGWNQVIEEIQPEWFGLGLLRGRIVGDFRIITTDGSSHSVIHCCSFPLETHEQIKSHWRDMDTPEYLAWYKKWTSGREEFKDSTWGKICYALKRGEKIFLEDGTRNPDWKLT
jgi:hypothetical protein